MDSTNFKYLNSINSPADLRKIKIEKLPEVCAETESVNRVVKHRKNPGHLGASLGAVEMAWQFIMFLTHQLINLYGMWVIRLMHIRFLPVAAIHLKQTEHIMASVVSHE